MNTARVRERAALLVRAASCGSSSAGCGFIDAVGLRRICRQLERLLELADPGVVAAAAGSAACAEAGGIWDAGTNTCAPPAGSSFIYNCFVAGFCAEAGVTHPAAIHSYVNDYEGHTTTSGAAWGSDCDSYPGKNQFNDGGTVWNAWSPTFHSPFWAANDQQCVIP